MDNNDGNYRPNIDRRNHDVDKNDQSTSSYSSSRSSTKPYHTSNKHKSASSYSSSRSSTKPYYTSNKHKSASSYNSSNSSTKPYTGNSQQHRASASESFYSSGGSSTPAPNVSSLTKAKYNRLTITIIICIVVIIVFLLIVIISINRNQSSDNKDYSISSIASEAMDNSNLTNSEPNIITESDIESDDFYFGLDICAYDHGGYYEEYNGSDDYFKLGGVSYNKGFTIGTYSEGYAIYNLEGNYKYFRGIAGNVDNVNYSLSYVIYGDDNLLGTIDIEGGALPVEFEFDISGIKKLKIIADGNDNYSNGVGFANTVVSNETKPISTTAEIDTNVLSYIGRDILAYDRGSYYEEYDGNNSFQLGGLSYYYGFCIGTYTSGGYASFNLDGKYNFFCGIAGNIDGTQYDVSYIIYGDSKILGTLDISAGTLPKEFSYDVKGIRQLKIVADGNDNYSCGVGFANAVLYNDKSLKPQLYQIPSYPSEVYIGRAVKAFQHGSYYEECSKDGEHIDIQGKKYYYGFKIGTYNDGGYASYNLNGEYKTISGKAGFEHDIIPVSYIIIGDGKEIGRIDFGSSSETDFRFDVSKVKQLTIQAEGDSNYGNAVTFANVMLKK